LRAFYTFWALYAIGKTSTFVMSIEQASWLDEDKPNNLQAKLKDEK